PGVEPGQEEPRRPVVVERRRRLLAPPTAGQAPEQPEGEGTEPWRSCARQVAQSQGLANVPRDVYAAGDIGLGEGDDVEALQGTEHVRVTKDHARSVGMLPHANLVARWKDERQVRAPQDLRDARTRHRFRV